MAIQIIPVQNRSEFNAFINFPYQLHASNPKWIPPLKFEQRERLHPKKNPFYNDAWVSLFLAMKDNRWVGRISSQISRAYERVHGERVGHFGFFECENDPEIARLLFEAAEAFHQKHGAKRSVGPFSFSINEESGLLIDGFDAPQMFLMPYHPSYYPSLVEAAGYQKIKDLYAWYYNGLAPIPEVPLEIAKAVAASPGLTIRTLNPKRLKQDLKIILDLFNDAWSSNWGFIPFSESDLEEMARGLRFLIDPEIILIAEVNGEPAAICFCLPNIYEMIGGLNGRLFPFGWAKLLFRKYMRRCKSARLLMLGVKKQYRGSVLGGLSVLLYTEIHRRGVARGYDWGELSWTLEDNLKINSGIELMGGKRYKTFRIYEKNL